MFERKLRGAVQSDWWLPVWNTSNQIAGFFITAANAVHESINKIDDSEEISREVLDTLQGTLEHLENWSVQLEGMMAEIAAIKNPRSNVELGLFDWAKHALSAQFVWVEISFNAFVLYMKGCLGRLPRNDALDFYNNHVFPNFESTQHLPRTLDFIQTKQEWPPRQWIDKPSALNDYARAKRISALLETQFP